MSENPEDNSTSLSLIQRLISKLNMVQATNQPSVIVNEEETPVEDVETSEAESSSSKNFKSFCREMERLLAKDNEQLSYYVYRYPHLLQKQLNVDVDELKAQLSEINEAKTSIQQLKRQRKLVKREKAAIKGIVQRINDSEVRELESILARNDRELYNRWAKAKWKADTLEELMFDVEEKQLALSCVTKLINRYTSAKDDDKSKIPFGSSASSLQTKSESKSLENGSSSSGMSSLARPVALGVSNDGESKVTQKSSWSSGSRLSWVQRRLRAEKRGVYATVRPSNITTTTTAETHEIPPFSFPLNVINNADFGTSPFDLTSSRFSCESTTATAAASNISTVGSTSSNATSSFDDDFVIDQLV